MNSLRFALLLALAAALSACASGGSDSGQATDVAGDVAGFEPDQGGLPQSTQLVVGTLSLEGGELAVSAEQAIELLPLWKAYRNLSSSDTTADAEIESLIAQIQEVMTPEQLQAIDDMQLSAEDMAALIEELGIQPQLREGAGGLGDGDIQFPPGGFEGGGGGGPGAGAGGGAGPGGGGGPGAGAGGGAGPGGGGGPGAGAGGGAGPGGGFQGAFEGGPPDGFAEGNANLDPDEIATLQAEGGTVGRFGSGGGTLLIDPLIELLESRAGAGT